MGELLADHQGGDPPDWPSGNPLPETNSETGTYTFFLTGRSLEDEFLLWGLAYFLDANR